MERKPRVIVDVERMKYAYTGLYYYCLHLSENLHKYYSGEFDFSFFGYSHVQFPEHLNLVPLKIWDKIYSFRGYSYDLWHGTWQLTKYIPNGKIKFILTIHDLNFLYTNKPAHKKKRLLKQIQGRIDRADAVTVISGYVKRDVEKHLNIGNKPVYVIYNGVELKEYPEFDSPRYRPEKSFLFTMGTVLYKKHFHVLPALLTDNEFELIIAGIQPDSKYVDQIIREAERFGVKDKVILTGPVSDAEKYWYLKHSEAFLFPSISEGFGLPPVEAMMLGKPVFLSTHTSLPEIGGDVAYYFENFEPEHMREVLRDGLNDYREHNRSEAIRKHAAKFTWENAVKQYAKVYRETLSGIHAGPKQGEKKISRKVTAVIPTLNEEKNIEEAIDAVAWADEILVIDSYSQDRTVELARRKGARVIQRKFDNFSNQKNYAIEQAGYDWIFVLDADERVPGELRDEILETLSKKHNFSAFWIPRKNFIGDKPVRFSGWENDKCIRLFNRRNSRYNGRYVHEEIITTGKTGHLKHKILHYTYENFQAFEAKLEKYSRLRALEWYERGKRYNPVMHLLAPAYRFFKHFIWHLGFLDGKKGFVIAKHASKAVWRRYSNLKALYEKKEEK